jgi:hypothetical protein
MISDTLINSFSDGNIFVDVYSNKNNRIYFCVHIGYKRSSSDKWKNQRITLVESDIPKIMGLLRLAVIMPNNSYVNFIRKAGLQPGGEVKL